MAEGHISIVSEIPEPRNAGNRAARLWAAARIPIILIEHEGDHVELSVLWPLPHHFGHRVSLLGLWDVRDGAVSAGEPRVGYAQWVL